jgi:hypothetical protein
MVEKVVDRVGLASLRQLGAVFGELRRTCSKCE